MKVSDMRSVYMLERVWDDGTSKPLMVSDQAEPIDNELNVITEKLKEYYGRAEQVYKGWDTRGGYSRISVFYGPPEALREQEYRVWILDFTPDDVKVPA